MELHPLSLAEIPASNFIRHYAGDFARLAQWYHYNPHDDASFALRLAELEARADAPSAEARAARSAHIAERMRAWGAGPAGILAAESLAESNTFAVVTGQQVGLYGGPLYTQLKAITAIRLARQLADRFPDRKFVPMFWMASGDSDFEEVRRSWTLSRGGELSELALPAQDNSDNRIMRVRDMSSELAALSEQLDEALPGGEFREEVIAALRECCSAGTLVDGFARWMARLFRDSELVIVDPQDPPLASAAAALIAAQLENIEAALSCLQERDRAIAAAGYPVQVEQIGGDSALFLLDDSGVRHKIVWDGGFRLRPGDEPIAREELLALSQEQPERFVCGVMTRPIYQNLLFPLAAWTGGSAEIAYRAQTTALFELHGQRMAPAFLRSTATLLPRRSAEVLSELGWRLGDCYVRPQDLAAKAALASRPQEIEAALASYRETLGAADTQLARLAMALDPALEQSFATLRGNLESHIDRLEKKITSALKQRDESLQRRVASLHSLVYPQLTPQERLLGLTSFLPRYGFGLVNGLLEALPAPSFEHQLVILD